MSQVTEITRTLTQDEFNRFADLSGDDNPIHVDPAFAATTRFGATVAHGLFLCTILRGLSDKLVPGGRQLSHSVVFPSPTYADRPIAFRAEIVAEDGAQVTVKMQATDTTTGKDTCLVESTFERSGAPS